ncbi:MAG: RNA-binding protein [Nitrospirae bacterium]|nr:RNA-binding protein [Nitrospirota bacterium]
MPKGPQGQKRPADVIGAAIKVAKIATGEIEEDVSGKEYTRRGGLIGGKARADKLAPSKRASIARIAAAARWKKSK